MRLWLLVLLAAGCSNFDPYNELHDLRVLAVRAEPPWIAEGEATTLDALTFSGDGSELSYAWSWCPFRTGPDEGYTCALTHAELQAAVDASLPDGVTVAIPPFELGNAVAAVFEYPLTAGFVEGMCAALGAQDLPDFVRVPDCNGGLDVSVQLVVSAGDQQIVAIKDVRLLFGPLTRNANPEVSGVSVQSFLPATLQVALATATPFTELARNTAYVLNLDLDDAMAETYTPAPTDNEPDPAARPETLIVTWFVEGGTTVYTRTGYDDGEPSLPAARRNGWVTPSALELEDPEHHLVVVVRDDRGGVGWLERTVMLADEEAP